MPTSQEQLNTFLQFWQLGESVGENIFKKRMLMRQQEQKEKKEKLQNMLGIYKVLNEISKTNPKLANQLLGQFGLTGEFEIKPETKLPVSVKKPEQRITTHPITGEQITETELTETGVKMVPGIMEVAPERLKGLPKSIQDVILEGIARQRGFEIPEEPETPKPGIFDWEYKGDKKRRVLRNPVTGETIWASKEWIPRKEPSITKPETYIYPQLEDDARAYASARVGSLLDWVLQGKKKSEYDKAFIQYYNEYKETYSHMLTTPGKREELFKIKPGDPLDLK